MTNQELFDGLKHLVALAREEKKIEEAKEGRLQDMDERVECRDRIEAYERAMALVKTEWQRGVGHGSVVKGEVEW